MQASMFEELPVKARKRRRMEKEKLQPDAEKSSGPEKPLSLGVGFRCRLAQDDFCNRFPSSTQPN